MKIPIIYVAAPFGGNPENLDKAERWAAWLSMRFEALFVVPWVPLCRHWVDSGETRKRGLELDLVAVRHCHGMIMVGGNVSPGMAIEKAEARELWDLHEFRSPEQLEQHSFEMDALAGWIRQVSAGAQTVGVE
jgi:hypothetical protein